jgi:hypothetical protein
MVAPSEWRNFDASPTHLLSVPGVGRSIAKKSKPFPDAVEFGDVVRSLPVDPGSCDAVTAVTCWSTTARGHADGVVGTPIIYGDFKGLSQELLRGFR